jgi:23S rRNA (guanosine2251-2'-O)-methyltransferase
VRGGRVKKLFVMPTAHSDKRLDLIKQLAKQRNIPIFDCEKRRLEQMVGAEQAHQGVAAQLSPVDYWEFEDFLKLLEKDRERWTAEGNAPESFMNNYVVGILDGIEDPHNLGAIVRVAECAGVKALFLPERRSASITSVVAKTSAGALATLPVVRIGNLVRALERLKESGFWIAGLDADARQSCFEADLNIPLAIVIGSEGKGMSRLVKEHCDLLLKIPMFGQTESLNASVAAAIVFYERVRQATSKATEKQALH